MVLMIFYSNENVHRVMKVHQLIVKPVAKLNGHCNILFVCVCLLTRFFMLYQYSISIKSFLECLIELLTKRAVFRKKTHGWKYTLLIFIRQWALCRAKYPLWNRRINKSLIIFSVHCISLNRETVWIKKI